MLRSAVLAVAGRPGVRRIATGGVGRRVALRFVAGEGLDDALAVVKSLNEAGATASLDHLGENVPDAASAAAAARAYLEAIDRIESAGLGANISVKLTQMGLDVDAEVANANTALLAHRAVEADSTITLDMEDHRYTDRTIDICLRLAHRYPRRVGVALQTYLRRSPGDLERVVAAEVPVRLCKGAYREPPEVAHQKRADVDRAYAEMLVALMRSRSYPMVATHDDRLIRFAKRAAAAAGRSRDEFEFQMLYGVRRELQRELVGEGYRLRVYVPFGREWYPYLTRRIAERPANVRFFVEALLRR